MRYLYNSNEDICLEMNSSVQRHPVLADGAFVAAGNAGEVIRLCEPGHYLIRERSATGLERERYLAVIGDHYTVAQLAIGTFTSDTFDVAVHGARIPVNYYVGLGQVDKETTFRGYEQEYGDQIIPHVMANSLALVDPALGQADPNWDSLPAPEIVKRLKLLAAWWEGKGMAPLRAIATYTPSNSLVRAMKEAGFNVMHSVIPEQNWSDGRWAINHWGMVNQPFYMGEEDFRKPVRRDEGGQNLLAMTMDSYHLYLPHVVGFGDFVLSPSHFLRWNRSVESGDQPERFTNFLHDYLQVARQNPAPYFLVAGFEFGRTFGTRSMTTHNRRGIERLIAASREYPLVFATARDVAAYYEKHCGNYSETVFTQRDYQTGVRMMSKPVNIGPSIGMEMHDFKAVFAHLDPLPAYHYDYLETWKYAFNDVNAPHDYAAADREAVQVERTGETLKVKVMRPLARAVPVAVWDGLAGTDTASGAFTFWYPPVLDDGRAHSVVILPAGWSGEVSLPFVSRSVPAAAEFSGLRHPLWRVQRIGDVKRRQCYLYLEEVLLEPLEIEFTVPAACRIESREKPLGDFQPGDKVTLRFAGRNAWYRFRGLEPEQIQPDEAALAKLRACDGGFRKYLENAQAVLAQEQKKLDDAVEAMIPAAEERILHMDCFGNAVMSERSRAAKYDRIVYRNDVAVKAQELSDGGIALEPGRSYWVHPRGVHAELTGLAGCAARAKEVVLYLFTRSPEGETWSYNPTFSSGGKPVHTATGPWVCAKGVEPGALYRVAIPAEQIIDGTVDCGLRATQLGVLDDWFRDGGYIAGIERFVVTLRV